MVTPQTPQRTVEFVNLAGHTIVVAGPNGEQVPFIKFQKRTLSQWFLRYVPRYLKLAGQQATVRSENRAQPIQKPTSKPTVVTAKVRLPERTSLVVKKPKLTMPTRIVPNKIVGRAVMRPEQARTYFREMLSRETFSVSNDIGIGILSYNRKASISRLVESIRRFTDLTKTTVFISDESTDQVTKDYVRSINDMVILDNKERLGVAGNTNRLLRCLERFRFKILLNDDVEVIANDWDIFYPTVMKIIGYHHFCQRMLGVYGADQQNGEIRQVDKFKIQTIHEKPHGAIMVFDNVAFEKVGYFDESFGQYGMEHVDWSNRVSISGIQPAGFHDVIGSNGFFKVYSDASAVESRASHLVEARRHYESVKNNTQRIYIAPTLRSEVPKLSYIIPFRGQDRFDAIRVALLNIKAQRFPCLDIIMVEQDSSSIVNFPEFAGVRKFLARSTGPFNKALAFNSGVVNSTGNLLVLHDADIMVGTNYSQTVYNLLQRYDSFHIGHRVLYLDQVSTMKMASQMKLTGDLAIERCVGYFEGGSLGCHFNTYLKIGGFCEEFIGYGNEDCEFYSRLTKNSNFYGERTADFVHLWHGRTPGWKDFHEKNKKLETQLSSMPMERRLNRVNSGLSKYGMRPR